MTDRRLTGLRRLRNRVKAWVPARSDTDAERIRFAIGSLEAREARSASTMRAAEFRAFSQFGEDGIIQWLIARVPIEREVFVEFGTGDYREANTRFLVEHDNWRGLICNSGQAHVQYLSQSGLAWRHSVDAVSAFITAENANQLLGDVAGDIGLLSVDVDGNDYWILNALSEIRPRIVVVEYNSVWGPDRAVSIPYDPAFHRASAHWSWLYFGGSLSAFCQLLAAREYRFVGSNSTGHNAFFVRDDIAGNLPALTSRQGWVESRFRDSRDSHGRMTYVGDHARRRALMADLPLVDVVSGAHLRVADVG